MTEREFHTAAEIFPMIDDRDFESLVADIGTHGLKVEIVLCDDKILDGRNRYRACQKAGVEPRFTRYEGDDPLSYVLSLNLRRRHLDASQRAMIAAKAADMRKLERLENPATLPVLTQPKVADQMQVSERSVRTAKKVLDHGAPELACSQPIYSNYRVTSLRPKRHLEDAMGEVKERKHRMSRAEANAVAHAFHEIEGLAIKATDEMIKERNSREDAA